RAAALIAAVACREPTEVGRGLVPRREHTAAGRKAPPYGIVATGHGYEPVAADGSRASRHALLAAEAASGETGPPSRGTGRAAVGRPVRGGGEP
ncbi:MAG TPA: hypothetical protein VFF02_14455, partial [Anaeromyxobacteraceae bacterium]|nr:hypothetical protein [Anaeromyxobacteraceae bacterium]